MVMIVSYFNHQSLWSRRFIESFGVVISLTFLSLFLLTGCDQQDPQGDKSENAFESQSQISGKTAENLKRPVDLSAAIRRVGEETLPCVVSIEVVECEETYEPLPYFTTETFFQHYFDVNSLDQKFKSELKGLGTGMIIDPQGHILTNNHVVRGATMTWVKLADGGRYPAKLIGTDPETDLAVIKISAQVLLPHVNFGDSSTAKVGENVVTAGHMERTSEISTQRLTQTVIAGKIRATHPNGITYCSGCPDYLSTDPGDNPGSSGGPLLNLHGEVVGVVVGIVSKHDKANAVGFAIPGNTAVSVARKLISCGRIEPGG
jgi:S1-C subfamily serine protease